MGLHSANRGHCQHPLNVRHGICGRGRANHPVFAAQKYHSPFAKAWYGLPGMGM